MHARSIAVILAGLMASACGAARQGALESDIPYVENALRLELVFGDEGLPEEFLLAEPRGLAVRDNGDILVSDEHHIKVYDAEGRPKERLGGQGQGPGEFQGAGELFLGSAGFLAVASGLSQFNLYSPDNTYVSRYNGFADPALRDFILGERLTFSYVTGMDILAAGRWILDVFGRNRDLPGKFPDFRYLIYSDGDSLEELIKHNSLDSVLNDSGGSTDSPYLGDFHWGVLNGSRIVHASTHQRKMGNGSGSTYSLNVLGLDDGSRSVIDVEYEPEVLPDSLRTLMTYRNRRIGLTIEPPPVLQSLLDDVRFLPAFQALRTDGDLVFLFRFNAVNEALERNIQESAANGEEISEGIYSRSEPYAVDIVDTAAGKLAARAEFSFIPDVIKAGRAYRLITPPDSFPKVECYRVDPAVYQTGR